MPARKMRRDVRALTARNHPEGRFYPMQCHALQDHGGGWSVCELDLLGCTMWGSEGFWGLEVYDLVGMAGTEACPAPCRPGVRLGFRV